MKKCPCRQEINGTFYHTARELILVAKLNPLRNTLLLPVSLVVVQTGVVEYLR
jgi:hypothetical protein